MLPGVKLRARTVSLRPLASFLSASLLALTGGSLAACGDDTADGSTPPTGVSFVFDLAADVTSPEAFYDQPYPSDLRLDAEGHPIVSGLPNPANNSTVTQLRDSAALRVGFPVLPVAFLRFTGPLPAQEQTTPQGRDTDAPIWLVDVDESSPDRGKLVPVVAKALPVDTFTPENVLAVAPVPGFVLRPSTTYAVVVKKSLGDADGQALAPNALLERLARRAPAAGEEAADALYAPLWSTLDTLGVAASDVAAATVFTTGAVVAETAAMGDAVLAAHEVTIEGLELDTSEIYPELCVLRGTVTYPQFQRGTPPFDTEGLFELDASGQPIVQRTETAPVAIAIPRATMPETGWPLAINVHGSGGYSIAMVRPVGDEGVPGDANGPAFPLASKGIAMAGSAMPVNPERLPGASETAYLNLSNLPAIADTFRQGIFETRLYVEALSKLSIDPALLVGCDGAVLPSGVTAHRFDVEPLLLTGQSMGGMYANLIGATEPLVRAIVPTGAGGHWTYFILETPLRNGAIPGFFQLLLGTSEPLSFFHPVLSLAAAGLEPADPVAYMPHVARRPLPGHPTRPIYEPVAIGDSYFPTSIYDAAALAYGHQQAGEEIWPRMQEMLALAGLDGFIATPTSNNLVSESGEPYTGVVIQFEADGPYDPHAIYKYRDDVKRQYSCFFDSFLRTGTATVVPPTSDWAAPCP